MRRSPAERSAVTVQGDGALSEVGWAEALERAAEALRSARELHGPDGVGVIGGARLTNEDAYAWTKLAKGVLGTDSVDCQLGDGLAPDLVLGLPRATIADACSAPAVVLLGPDLKEELPVLYLRLRRAALDGATKLVELSPRATGLTPYAAVSVRYRPGEAPDAARAVVTGDTPDADLAAAASIVRGAPGAVVIVGRPSVAEQPGTIADAVAALAALPGVRFLSGLRRGNVHGALDMGMAPGVLPGRVALDDGREWLSRCWPTVPTAKGLDAEGMLVAASEGRLPVLILLGADPLSDFPDRALARRGIAGAGFVLAVDTTRTPSVEAADVVLAAAGYAEKHGTTTNLEGRVTRLAQKVTPPGTARADWELAVELALRMGEDLGFDTLAALQAEMAVMAPAYAGVTEARLSRPDLRDGVVVPVTQAVPAPQTIEEAATTAGGAASQVTETTEADAVAAQGPTPLPDAVPTAEAPLPESPGAPPPLLKWEAPAAAADPPPVDAYALRLIASRQLYDDGTLVATSGSLAPLVRPLVLQLNRYDLDRLGVGDGGTVRVSSPRGAIEVSVKAADEVPRGAAWMAFNVGDPGAADLIDSTAAVTELRVETP
jgi:NADH-quinone oxidoreductase subunit G